MSLFLRFGFSSLSRARARLMSSSVLKVKTFNKIDPIGLQMFPTEKYDVSPDHGDAQAILLRSQKLTPEDIPLSVRSIARCGAGTNNCQVDLMTEYGVPVFNTPGSNANAVKELVLCSLFLASRGIIDGAAHMQMLHKEGVASERIEKDKALFGGQEIKGKTLGVIGLGAIGAEVAEAASNLGMTVYACDPHVSESVAWKIDGRKVKRVQSVREIAQLSDYISIHVPFIKGETENLLSDDFFLHMKSNAHILNFARGGIVDSAAFRKVLDSGSDSRYICDFADDLLWDHENVTIIPHLGASTAEAEEVSAKMAAETTMTFIETGCIKNSVNLPNAELSYNGAKHTRLCVTNRNEPGVLHSVFDALSKANHNVEQQLSASKDTLAYHIIDFSTGTGGDFTSIADLQKHVTMLPNVLSTRIISGNMGSGFAVQRNGEYII